MNLGEKIRHVAQMIENAESIVITTHEHPDGDAVGSSSALAYYLKSIGKHDINLIRDSIPDTIAFIDSYFKPVQPELVCQTIKRADLILCTDFADLERCGIYADAIRDSKAPKILFDHHASPKEEEFDVIFSKIDISSSCEVVFNVLDQLCEDEDNKQKLFESECGYCLMCGMTTDTNNFSCATYPSTFQMASRLLGYGIDRDDIISKLYNRYRENRVRAFAGILSDNFTIREDGLAVICVSEADWHKYGLKEGELEGLVNVPLSIDTVKVCIYFREDSSTVRVSIRAKKGWSARKLAMTWFHGGGHELASGGKLHIGEDLKHFSEINNYLKKIKL